MTQPSLFDGFGEKQIEKYFFAIFPPAEAAAELRTTQALLMRAHGLSGKPVAPDRLHITLCHLGDYEGENPDVEARARRAGAALAASPFSLALDYAASFAGNPYNRPFVLRGGDGVSGVEALQRLLHVEMAKAGLGKWARPYTPHLTLTYGDRAVADRPIDPIRWRVDSFTLVRSEQGRTAHHHLERWALRG